MRRVSTGLLAGLVLMLAVPNANAIIVAGASPDDPQWLAANSSSDLSGVAFFSDNADSCSAAFFESSLTYLVTAAHCVSGFTSGYVQTSNGSVYQVASVMANPGYSSSNILVDDIAVITLQTAANSATTAYYPLYSGVSPVNDEFLLAGFGDAGTGTAGNECSNSNPADCYTAKTDRDGLNFYNGIVANSTDLSYVFFDPNTTTYPYANLNIPDSSLATIGPGDSGGPSFVNIGGQLEIAGVHSATGCPGNNQNCTLYEYGDVAVDTNVSLFTGFVDSVAGVTATPEPGTFAAMGTGLLAVVLCLVRKRKAA
jgi:Trypsin/PEP-CTERM motif